MNEYLRKFCYFFLLIFVVSGCTSNTNDTNTTNATNANPAHTYYQILENKHITLGGFQNAKTITLSNGCAAASSTAQGTYYCLNAIFPSDIDGDGDLDIVLGPDYVINQSHWLNKTPSFQIFFNDGAGNFTFYTSISRTSSEYLSDVSDLDGDNVIDLIGYDFWNNSSFVLFGKLSEEKVAFGNKFSIATGTHGGESYALDYNGDGQHDLVMGSSGSGVVFTLHVNENVGDQFVYKRLNQDYRSISFHAFFTPLIDLNKDGLVEFMVQSGSRDDLDLYISSANGNYSLLKRTTDIIATGFEDPPYIGRFYDPALDQFIVSGISNHDGRYKEYVYDREQEEFILVKNISAGLTGKRFVADINSDGKIDVLSYSSASIEYALQTSTGTGFEAKQTIGGLQGDSIETRGLRSVGSNMAISVKDYNGDGIQDIMAISNSGYSAYLNILIGYQPNP